MLKEVKKNLGRGLRRGVGGADGGKSLEIIGEIRHYERDCKPRVQSSFSFINRKMNPQGMAGFTFDLVGLSSEDEAAKDHEPLHRQWHRHDRWFASGFRRVQHVGHHRNEAGSTSAKAIIAKPYKIVQILLQ